jgi:hypothetical protein
MMSFRCVCKSGLHLLLFTGILCGHVHHTTGSNKTFVCHPTFFFQVVFNDDVGVSLLSAVSFETSPDTTYYVLLTGYDDFDGVVTLRIDITPSLLPPSPPSKCLACVPSYLGYSVDGSSFFAW